MCKYMNNKINKKLQPIDININIYKHQHKHYVYININYK